MEVAGRKSELDISGSGSTEENDGNFYCDPCENEGDRQQAEGFCEDCQEYLCSSCYKVHKRPAVWRHHVLLDKHAMPKTKTKDKSSYECIEPCPEHSSKIIEYYCQTHDQLGCTVCITRDHRTCTDIDYIPQIAAGYGESSEINEVLEALEELLQETAELTTVANNDTLNVSEHEKKAKAEVKQIRDEFNDICDKLVEDIETVKRSDESKLTQSIERFEEISKKIKARSAVLDKKREEINLAQLFTDAKRSKLSVNEFSKELKVARENARIRHYNVDVGLQTLRECLKLNFHVNKTETGTGLEQCRPTDELSIQSTRETITDAGNDIEEQASKISRLLDDLKQTETAAYPRQSELSPVKSEDYTINAQRKPNLESTALDGFQLQQKQQQRPPQIPPLQSGSVPQQKNFPPQPMYPLFPSCTPPTLTPWMKPPHGMQNVLHYPGPPYCQPRLDHPGTPYSYYKPPPYPYIPYLSSPPPPFGDFVSTKPPQIPQASTASATSNQVLTELNRKKDLTKGCNSEISEVGAMLNDLIATKKEDNDAVSEWIERAVDAPSRKQPGFVRALMTIICNNAIKGTKGQEIFEPKVIKEREELLERYIGGDSELELQALYAVQALVSKLGHPPGVFRGIFDTLYGDDITCEDAFVQWQNSDDEPEGKTECLKETAKFFTWLDEACED